MKPMERLGAINLTAYFLNKHHNLIQTK